MSASDNHASGRFDFRSIIGSSPMGVHLYRLEGDGRLVFEGANPAANRILGVDNAIFVGKTIEEAFPPLAQTEVPSRYRDAASHGAHWETEEISYEDEKITGAFQVHAFQTCPGHMAAMFLDITERKRAEEALQRSEARLKSMFRVAPTGIGVVRDRVIVEVNDRVCEIVGYTKDELVGQSARILYPTSEEYEFVGREKYAQIREFGTGTVETRWVHKDGTVIDVVLSSTPINPDDLNRGVTFTALDITERRRMELRLRQSEKMEAIGQLAGGVAHDFSNQLAGVMGYADLIRDSVTDDAVLCQYAEKIMVICRRASDLTVQLLAFARRGRYQSVPVNVHKTIQEVISLLEHSTDKRIRIGQLLNASHPICRGDPTQLQNALLNLALNARDAMPEGGDLRFQTDLVDLDEHYCASSPFGLTPGRFLQVSVSDSGVGIDPETERHIFEPFFTTKEQGKGTGMGLAAVWGTVKNHHGAVNVYSKPGIGTTFRLYLPADPSDEAATETAGAAPARRGTGRILLVEDEEMVRQMATDLLQSLGYMVTSCGDGSEAVEIYARSWRRFDLVILDMLMPVMGGRETFLKMKEINPAVRALLSSGYSINGEVQEI